MKITKVSFSAGEERLAGNIIYGDGESKPRLLFLHGAGKATKERSSYLAFELAKHGIGSFSFDFSGHGESSGRLEESSLKKRLAEASVALHFLDKSEGITVCGSSMGAHIALELVKTAPVKTLVLFCPAIYDRNAVPVPFNRGFSAIIRRQGSWRNTDVFGSICKFTGNLLIVTGEKDEVIPGGVIEALDSQAGNAKNKEIIRVPDAGHQIHTWLSEHSDYASLVIKRIVQMSDS